MVSVEFEGIKEEHPEESLQENRKLSSENPNSRYYYRYRQQSHQFWRLLNKELNKQISTVSVSAAVEFTEKKHCDRRVGNAEVVQRKQIMYGAEEITWS